MNASRWSGLALVVVVAAAACGGPEAAAPEPYVPGPLPEPAVSPRTPTGDVVVAYPEEPGVWYPPLGTEVAATDLAHLWGLPLYRYDAAGHLREALLDRADVVELEAGWGVDVWLREGRWSDGEPVSARDVAATVSALQAAPETADEFAVITRVEEVGARVARLVFEEPYARWPYLLAGGVGVLPAHVLAETGLPTYRGPPDVTGGPFRVSSHEPGRRVVFEAHSDSPEGAPGLQRLEVAFVPDVDTALGLLRDGEAAAVIGHLALNPVDRIPEGEGFQASAPLGGTSLWWRWQPDGGGAGAGSVGVRRSVRSAIDVEPQVEGLFPGLAEVARSLLPGGAGPWGRDGPAPSLAGADLTLSIPRWQEAPAFTARSVQRDLRSLGGSLELVRLEPDVLAGFDQGDARLEVRRDGPWPSLAVLVSPGDGAELRAAAVAADRAVTRDASEVVTALERFHDTGHVLPLYRIGVTHAWRDTLRGVVPSSWPGAGLWNAHTWRTEGG